MLTLWYLSVHGGIVEYNLLARFELEEKTLFYFVDFDTVQSKSDDVQQVIPSKEDGKSL